MSISPRSLKLLDRIQQRSVKASAKEADSEPVGSVLAIIGIVLEMFAKFAPLLEFCKTPVPPTPPVPDTLSAVGVTQETYHQAFVSKFGAEQSVEGDGFKKAAIRRATTEIKKSKGIKRKAALPLAIAALQAGRDETLEDLAVVAQQVKDNASQFGV